MTDPARPQYRLDCAQRVLDQLRRYSERAEELGIKDKWLEALQTINHRLKTDPLGWGDPLYRLEALRLLICHRVYWSLHVTFGVEEERRLVFIKEIKPLSSHPFHPPA